MINSKIFDRVEDICNKLQNNDALDDKMTEFLYAELEGWMEEIRRLIGKNHLAVKP